MNKILNSIIWTITIICGLCLVSYYFPNTNGEAIGSYFGGYVLPAAIGIGIYYHFKEKKEMKKRIKNG